MAQDRSSAEKKKERNRRAHLRDFHPDEKGAYRYEGRVRKAGFSGDGADSGQERFRTQVRRMWAAAASLIPALVVIGTLPPEVMEDRALLLIPYILEMLLAVRILWALWRITSGGGTLREYQFETAAARQPLRCRLLAGAAGVSRVFGIVRVLTGTPPGQPAGIAIWFGMQCALCACALVLGKLHKEMRWS